MAIITSDSKHGPPPRQRSHVTHWLGCGCVRMSSGAYVKVLTCGFAHIDHLVKDGTGGVSPHVHYACGCTGYCWCGAEKRLREAKAKADAKAKAEANAKKGES